MSGMQRGILPSPGFQSQSPLRAKSDSDSEDNTITTTTPATSDHDWSPGIEKCQPYTGLLGHEHDRDDYTNTCRIDREALGPCQCQRRRAFLYMASYVAFATMSFFSAAYYFWCLIPYEPSESNYPFLIRGRR
ncbi:hypothetical protein BO71DRAFT_403037 [Aspergillus ellipticus CBS 707.79]|uniref:Uncharacterized protein n=1 Tax=Aspergillus ellipticus CBS 707.79 TaxID=1448320 RepID=A0A319EEK6_9EURO|nr:hypothetical protein BO71DRAFT_403037 [Aspergillus ellipticus CBS 707.79]